MNLRDAEADIHAIAAADEAKVFLTRHGKRRDPTNAKPPLTKQEIVRVLEAGSIVEGPAPDLVIENGWKFTMVRTNGDERHVVAGVLVPQTKVVVITGYPDRSVPVARRPRRPGGIGGDGQDTE